jgi:hypothetical protein
VRPEDRSSLKIRISVPKRPEGHFALHTSLRLFDLVNGHSPLSKPCSQGTTSGTWPAKLNPPALSPSPVTLARRVAPVRNIPHRVLELLESAQLDKRKSLADQWRSAHPYNASKSDDDCILSSISVIQSWLILGLLKAVFGTLSISTLEPSHEKILIQIPTNSSLK